jgi:hypothetical protein
MPWYLPPLLRVGFIFEKQHRIEKPVMQSTYFGLNKKKQLIYSQTA